MPLENSCGDHQRGGRRSNWDWEPRAPRQKWERSLADSSRSETGEKSAHVRQAAFRKTAGAGINLRIRGVVFHETAN